MTTMMIRLPEALLKKFMVIAASQQREPDELVVAWIEKFVDDGDSTDFVTTGIQLMHDDIELYRLLA